MSKYQKYLDCQHRWMKGYKWCVKCGAAKDDLRWMNEFAAIEVQRDELLAACEAAWFVLQKYDTRDEWEAGQTVFTAIAKAKGENDE